MADYTAEHYREAFRGYVGPNKITQKVTNETVISGFTTHELATELERRKKNTKEEFRKLVLEMYSLGYTGVDLDDIINEV